MLHVDKTKVNEFLADYWSNADNPGAFGGRDRLYAGIRQKYGDSTGITRREVMEFLRNNETSQKHQQPNHKKVNRPIVVKGPFVRWAADLIFLKPLAPAVPAAETTANASPMTIFTMIDCFSKYAWAKIVPSKSSKDVAAALESILDGEKHKPTIIFTDNGLEFAGKFDELLKAAGIKHLRSESYNPTQNSIIERFNKTLKSTIYKWYTAVNATLIDAKHLKKLVTSYNNTLHSTIHQTPATIHIGQAPTDIQNAALSLKARAVKLTKENAEVYPNIRIGDMVRIHARTMKNWRAKTKLKKYGYEAQWSTNLFKVSGKSRAKPGLNPQYTLFDMTLGEDLPRKFIRSDLQLVDKSQMIKELPDGHYTIEKVIGKKTLADGNVKYLVKWVGWPQQYNMWIKPQASYQKFIDQFESR